MPEPSWVSCAPSTRAAVTIGVLASICVMVTACTSEKAVSGSLGSGRVAGSGKDRYFVRDASGNGVTNAGTNSAVDLPAGSYIVELNNTARPVTVREGQQSTVTAGTVMVVGTGNDRYFARDVSGKGLTNAGTNAQHVLAERRHSGVDVTLIRARDCDRRATGRESSRRGQADSARTTSDERNFACK